MIAMPTIAIAAPTRSQRVGTWRSTIQSQKTATATYTPPYAAPHRSRVKGE